MTGGDDRLDMQDPGRGGGRREGLLPAGLVLVRRWAVLVLRADVVHASVDVPRHRLPPGADHGRDEQARQPPRHRRSLGDSPGGVKWLASAWTDSRPQLAARPLPSQPQVSCQSSRSLYSLCNTASTASAPSWRLGIVRRPG